MIFNEKENEYIRPSVKVLDVACEAGFRSSTGDLSYSDGSDGGWYDF